MKCTEINEDCLLTELQESTSVLTARRMVACPVCPLGVQLAVAKLRRRRLGGEMRKCLLEVAATDGWVSVRLPCAASEYQVRRRAIVFLAELRLVHLSRMPVGTERTKSAYCITPLGRTVARLCREHPQIRWDKYNAELLETAVPVNTMKERLLAWLQGAI